MKAAPTGKEAGETDTVGSVAYDSTQETCGADERSAVAGTVPEVEDEAALDEDNILELVADGKTS